MPGSGVSRLVYSRQWPAQLGDGVERRIVLLQGPVGPFFGRLGKALKAAGYAPIKINFNGGDWLYSRGEGTLNFRGDLAAWHDWFGPFLDQCRPMAIFVFGDQRPVHQVAVALAREKGIPVWSFEEGYLRPHFITMERDGNNAFSPIAASPDMTETEPPEFGPYRPFGASTFFLTARIAFYYFWAETLGRPFYPGYRHHRRFGLAAECVLWWRNGIRKTLRGSRDVRRLTQIIEHDDRNYFVVALQVVGDLQLTVHGAGWTMQRLISAAIAAFARSAGPRERLVFKGHPLDRGHSSHREFIAEMARLAKVAERVDFIDDGSLALLIRHARGAVMVNSTSGYSALYHGTPLIALGNAPYKRAGLTAPASEPTDLDRFFAEPIPPDAEQARKFLGNMRWRALVNGSYYLPEAEATTFANIIAKFEGRYPAGLSDAESGETRRGARPETSDASKASAGVAPSARSRAPR